MRLINIGSIALNHSEGHRMGSRLLKKPVLGGLWNLYGFFHFFLHLWDFFFSWFLEIFVNINFSIVWNWSRVQIKFIGRLERGIWMLPVKILYTVWDENIDNYNKFEKQVFYIASIIRREVPNLKTLTKRKK